MKINNSTIEKVLGRKHINKIECKQLGPYNSKLNDTLSFLDDVRYLSDLITNENISAVICTEESIERITQSGKIAILSDDPRYDFYTLHNTLAKSKNVVKANIIHKFAQIHPSAHISEYNVSIDEHVIVEPNVTILPGVNIGKRCIIRAGAVIGTEGFQHMKTKKGILSVIHIGEVVLGDNVEVKSNSCINKGLDANTCIEDNVKINDLCSVGHNVIIRSNTLIGAGCSISGSTVIEKNCWIGPNVTIKDRLHIGENAFIAIGSVVLKDVAAGDRVMGYPARSIKQ